MSNYSKEIWTLITRVLSGEATSSEKYKFRMWLDEDPKHKEFFRNIESSWTQEPEQPFNTFFYDYESGLNRLRDKLDREKPVKKGNSNSVMRRIPFKRKHALDRYSWAITAVVFIAITVFVYSGLQLAEQPDVLVTYSTSSEEQRIITLSDGSVVRLNNDSKIEVRINENAAAREVYLQGEAFFDVNEDPTRPFIIQTDESAIEVLGTSFNVKEGDGVMVVVKEGIVSLRNLMHEEKSTARLTAGQVGILSKNGHDVKIEETNIENYLGWMNGFLRFESMPFDQVIRQLERIYGMRHALDDPGIASVQLSVYTERMAMEEVLTTIAFALDVGYYSRDGVIHWQWDE